MSFAVNSAARRVEEKIEAERRFKADNDQWWRELADRISTRTQQFGRTTT